MLPRFIFVRLFLLSYELSQLVRHVTGKHAVAGLRHVKSVVRLIYFFFIRLYRASGICVDKRERLRGGDLTIRYETDGTVRMTGPAAFVCDGELL